jgi:hypothetical protein
MKLDSSYKTQWKHYGNGNFNYRKMDDEVEVYGGFVGVGIKYVFSRFFVDSNLGIGKLVVTHDMIIYEALQPYAGYYEEYNPPLEESLYESNFTVNFSINIGIRI